MSSNANKPLISFDYAMKYILRDKSDYSIIEGFLSALLATANYKPVKVKAFLESESNKDEARGKRIVADMVVEDTDGIQYIVEIERNEKFDFMHKACFSTSRLIVDHVGQGQQYQNIKKVIHISLLYFDIGGRGSIFHGKTIMHNVDTKEKLHLQLKEDHTLYNLVDVFPEYFVISIPEFHDEINRSIDEWLYMMKHEEIREDFQSKYIKLAAERLQFLKMSPDERYQYEKYQLEMNDVYLEFRTQYIKGEAKGRQEGIEAGKALGMEAGKALGIEEGKALGIEEGKALGIEEGKHAKAVETAKKMLSKGFSYDEVADFTELDIKQIKHFKQ